MFPLTFLAQLDFSFEPSDNWYSQYVMGYSGFIVDFKTILH